MNTNLTKEDLKKLYGSISPFEFKDKLISLASQRKKDNEPILDAGRGNPNWTAATPRQAFFTFGQFAVCETQKTWINGDLAGMPKKEGIAKRLEIYLNENNLCPGIELIKDIVNYGISKLGFDADEWVYELADGIIGDNYPSPDRILRHIEKVVNNYLMKELCQVPNFQSDFDVFGVEGGTAAMCYIFDSLWENNLLKSGDKIALMTPIFTPYLEIPHLPNYNFEVVNIKATEGGEGNDAYQYPVSELEKLKDTSIKAVCIVNPSNPTSVSMSDDCKETLIDIVHNYNPNLMIITDDVYCTFVNNFRSIIADLPYNTIGVYSLSKYFGVTGWRLGAILLNQKNIFNELISKLPKDEKLELNDRYKHLSSDPESISFMDRLVADSRKVALNHTAGLSTPQQVQMAFFCAFTLMDSKDVYKNLTIDICKKRKKLLYEGLDIELDENIYDASYYNEFNILNWANKVSGEDFVNYIRDNYTLLDVLYDLAKNHSIVLLNGDGFSASNWALRTSLANLEDENYLTIGRALKGILDKFLVEYKNR